MRTQRGLGARKSMTASSVEANSRLQWKGIVIRSTVQLSHGPSTQGQELHTARGLLPLQVVLGMVEATLGMAIHITKKPSPRKSLVR